MCKKNEANIIFTQIINNEKIVLQLCSECAKKKGLSVEFETVSLPSASDSFINELIDSSGKKEKKKNIPDLTCEVCKETFAEFKETGLFGCDKCHEAFGNHIDEILKQIHGTSFHYGKEPKEAPEVFDKKQQLKNLKAQLKHCVEMEDYERAAKLRDQITELVKREKTE